MSDIVKQSNTNNPGNLDKLKRLQGLKPKISSPKGLELPRLFYQKIIFILDASGSMMGKGASNISKGKEVSIAVNKVLDRLKHSKNKNCFDITVYTYSAKKDYGTIIKNKIVTDIIETNFDPTTYQKPLGTYLSDALNEAINEANEYLTINKNKNSQALIIVLSDGAITDYNECYSLTENNKNLDIATIYFEGQNTSLLSNMFGVNIGERNKDILKNIATKEMFYVSVNAEDIRNQMIKSISTVSKID